MSATGLGGSHLRGNAQARARRSYQTINESGSPHLPGLRETVLDAEATSEDRSSTDAAGVPAALGTASIVPDGSAELCEGEKLTLAKKIGLGREGRAEPKMAGRRRNRGYEKCASLVIRRMLNKSRATFALSRSFAEPTSGWRPRRSATATESAVVIHQVAQGCVQVLRSPIDQLGTVSRTYIRQRCKMFLDVCSATTCNLGVCKHLDDLLQCGNLRVIETAICKRG